MAQHRLDSTMIVGLYITDFALLNKITRKIKDKNIKLRHVENLPVIDKEIKVLISKKRIKNCKTPQIQLENLDILELRIRCEIYKCYGLIIGIDPGGVNGLSVIDSKRILFMDTYDNVEKKDYTNILVLSGYYDSQVQYWEPLKWVAKLRDKKIDNNILLLNMNMDAGHGGSSGRFKVYKEIALEYSFLCKLENINK